MAANKYPGPCYRCGETVAPKTGDFERQGRTWFLQHYTCRLANAPITSAAYLAEKAAASNRRRGGTLEQLAAGTGEKARRARKQLRDAGSL